METAQNTPNKTKELILYLTHLLQDSETWGATMLNKALYLIDNHAYLHNGSKISGFTYIKQKYGPTPAPTQFFNLRSELLAEGTIVEDNDRTYFQHTQRRLIATREPNRDLFQDWEHDIIKSISDAIFSATAKGLSDYTHDSSIAWQVADDREELPTCTFLLTQIPPSEKTIQWAYREKQNYLQQKNGL